MDYLSQREKARLVAPPSSQRWPGPGKMRKSVGQNEGCLRKDS